MGFPDSSNSINNRLHSAAVRAMDAHARVKRRALQICEELDEVTSPHGIPNTNLSEEDSLVVVTEAAIAAAKG